jgi:hypothetical protein
MVTKNSNRLIVDCTADLGTIHADQTRFRQRRERAGNDAALLSPALSRPKRSPADTQAGLSLEYCATTKSPSAAAKASQGKRVFHKQYCRDDTEVSVAAGITSAGNAGDGG